MNGAMSPGDNDDVILITGGSSGLGRVLALEGVRRGARVVIVARDAERLAETYGSIQTEVRGARIWSYSCDIQDDDQVVHLFQRVGRDLGRLNVLINCAGKSARSAIVDTTPQQFQELWELNFLSLVRCTRAALPLLRKSRGHIVNIGSLASKAAARYLGPYPASKFAVAAYSQQLRLELAEDGIHVLLVCPGPIRRDDQGVRYASTDVPLDARQPGGGVRIRGIAPDDLAKRIFRACDRRQLELVVPSRARWLFAIGQLFPRLGDWLIMKMTR